MTLPAVPVDTYPTPSDPYLPALPAAIVPTTSGRAVLRQTLYALTRPVGDLAPGTMVAPLSEQVDPTSAPTCYVEDGAQRGAYVRACDVERVTGLVVLVDHVDGYSSAFPRIVDETRARAFAAATLALPAVAGAWVGEVIRQH